MTKKRAGRIISGILTICILTQLMMISAVSAKAPDTTENQLKVLSVLGIMDEVPETNVTRGEFAYYAAKMADIDIDATVSQRYFKDIDKNNRIAAAVHGLYERGIVAGTEDGTFSPNEEISPRAAAVMLLRMAGYGAVIKDFNGYGEYISKYNLSVGGTKLSGADAARMLCRALDIQICTVDQSGEKWQYSISEEETLGKKYFDLYKVNGMISAADKISLDTAIGTDEARIGGVDYRVLRDDTKADLYQNLGMYVEAYIREDQADGDEVLCVLTDDQKNEVITIFSRDLEDVSDELAVSYETKNRSKTTRLEKNAVILKNGQLVTRELAASLRIKNGTIKLIAHNGKYDTAIVSAYDYVYVSKVDTVNEMVYAKHGESINLEREKYDRFQIITAEGKTGSVSDLKPGILLAVLRSDNMLEINICQQAVLAAVQGIGEDYLTLDGEEYEIDPLYMEELKSLISIGKKGTFFLNNFDEISYFTQSGENANVYGFLVKCVADEADDSDVTIKMFTEEGKMERYKAAQKVRIDGKTYQCHKAPFVLEEAGDGIISQLVIYKLNADGEISYIDTAKQEQKGTGLRITGKLADRNWYAAGRLMLPDVALKKNGIIFKTPAYAKAASASDNEFKLVTSLNNKSQRSIAYSTDGDGFWSDVIVLPIEKMTGSVSWAASPYMVCDVYEAYDETDEEIKNYVKLAGGEQSDIGIRIYEVSDTFEVLPGIPYPVDYPDEKCVSYQELDVGDIVMCAFDQDKKISHILMFFDYGNPEFGVERFDKYITDPMSQARFVGGYALEKDGEIVSYTRTYASSQVDGFAHFNGTPVIVFDDEQKKENRVYIGSAEDVNTYEEVKGKCSFVAPFSFEGWARETFVYKNGIQK